jgi:bacterioferritin-associated ferredoxin
LSNDDLENTVVCRCEDVTLREIRDLLSHGFKTMDEIKRISKCGMGPCQGKTCRQVVMREVARAAGKDITKVEVSTFRPPAENIKLGTLAEAAEEKYKKKR